MKKILFSIMLVLIFPLLGDAYSFTLQGFLRDQNGDALANYKVRTFCTHEEGMDQTLTNSSGYFSLQFEIPSAQSFDIILYASGFYNGTHQNVILTVQPYAGTTNQDLELMVNSEAHPDLYAYFIPYSDQPGHNLHFFNASISSHNLEYYWDFGGGETDDDEHPVHHINFIQNQRVSLEITDEVNAQTSMITALLFPEDLQVHSLDVELDSYFLPEGSLYQFQYENGQSQTIMVKSQVSDGQGFYYGLAFENYIFVEPHIDLGINVYPFYYPTYYGSTARWQDATDVDFQSLPGSLSLLNYAQPYFGSGSIKGSVVREDNRILSASQDNLINAFVQDQNFIPTLWADSTFLPCTIYLMNEDHDIIDFQLVEGSGDFEFNDLPFGEYVLRTEVFHKTHSQIYTLLTYDYPSTEGLKIEVQQTGALSSDFIADLNADLNVFPNPCRTGLTVSSSIEELSNIQVLNLEGKMIKQIKSNAGGSVYIDLSDFPSGIYVLRVEGDKNFFYKRIQKI